MSETADKYTELMAPAFVNGLGGVTGVLREEPEIPLVGLAKAQQLVRPLLESVDWEATGLPYKSFGTRESEIGEKDISPRKYAGRLMAFAFDDALDVMTQCELFVSDYPPAAEMSFGKLLLNSRKPVLAISNMIDAEKSKLISALKTPEFADPYLSEELVGPAMQYVTDKDGNIRLDWSDQINEWILDHKEESRGCPASKMIVQGVDGRRQVLTLFFWEKLVLSMHSVADN